MQGIKIYKLEKNKKSPNLIVGEIKKNFNFICKRFNSSYRCQNSGLELPYKSSLFCPRKQKTR